MTSNITEHELWAVINGLGWWFWGAIAAMAGANAVNIFRLAAPRTMLGRVIRVTALSGFFLIFFSWGNTAFGPLGLPLVLLSFFGMTYQMRLECVKAGLMAPKPAHNATVAVKVFSAMVEHPQ